MTTTEILLLGAIAGFTIFLGLPVARMGGGSTRIKTFLSGVSAGVLAFLFFEVMHKSFEIVEEAAEHIAEGEGGSWGELIGLGALFTVSLGVGLLSLVFVLRALKPTRASIGPGAMAVAEVDNPDLKRRDALNLGMSIAAAIGVHNFSEGLTIGSQAAAGETEFALLLVIGYALHNATEGFGIAGPLGGAGARASWKWILAAGLIGGGPTFLGTIVGRSFTSEYADVVFLALAGGAILYVMGELFAGGRKLDWSTTLWGTFVGLLAGGATELIIKLA